VAPVFLAHPVIYTPTVPQHYRETDGRSATDRQLTAGQQRLPLPLSLPVPYLPLSLEVGLPYCS